MSFWDIRFWLRSARADADLKKFRAAHGAAAAFDKLYADNIDPWGFEVPQFSYQRRKYQTIVSLIPNRHYEHALDLGCGVGLLTQQLAGKADQVLGLDVSTVAIQDARARVVNLPNIAFEQADVLNLSSDLDGRFDLLIVADVLYYLQPMSDWVLKETALRLRRLLKPGGVCVLANHFFFEIDPDSRLSRRIHQAFAWSPGFGLIHDYRRAFYLVSVLEAV
jgi:predicted TPR repeat methyltransferase